MTPVRPAHDARGQQVQREVPVAELDGVAGVVAAVVARDDVESVGEKVDDLALALVAPLPAQDRQRLSRAFSSLAKSSAG